MAECHARRFRVNGERCPLNDMTKNIVLWLVIACVLYVVAQGISHEPTVQTVDYSEFIKRVENGGVARVEIQDYRIRGEDRQGKLFETVTVSYTHLTLPTKA